MKFDFLSFIVLIVFVFAPSSSKPVHTITNVNSSEPIAALFVPRANPLANSPEWLVNSRLLIVDDQQVRLKDLLCEPSVLTNLFDCRNFTVWMTIPSVVLTRS